MPAFQITGHVLSDVVWWPRPLLVRCSSSTVCLPFVVHDEEWPTECQTCCATFSSSDKRILTGYYTNENELK